MAAVKKLTRAGKKLKEADVAKEVKKLAKRTAKSVIDRATRAQRGLPPLPDPVVRIS